MKTSPESVKAFRAQHGLRQVDLEQMMGFGSNGTAVRRWEAVNAPYQIQLIFNLIEAHGIELAKKLAEKGVERTERSKVREFRQRHNLSGEQLDRLFGFQSKGRATRRWEDPLEKGTMPPVTLLMAYVDEFGWDELRRIADELDAR